MLDNVMLGKFSQSFSTGSGVGIDVSTTILSVTKLRLNAPDGAVLVKLQELTPCELKCNEGAAKAGVAINADAAKISNPF